MRISFANVSEIIQLWLCLLIKTYEKYVARSSRLIQAQIDGNRVYVSNK